MNTEPGTGRSPYAARKHDHHNPLAGGKVVPSKALDATGEPSSETFLRGDDTWAEVPVTAAARGFDPNEDPVVIGSGATTGNGATPDNIAAGPSTAIVIGAGAEADASGTIAIGDNTLASAFGTTAVGSNARATQNNAIAVGIDAAATALSSLAIGQVASASATDAIAIGDNAAASDTGSVAIGVSAQADSGIAIGPSAHSGGGVRNLALGDSALAGTGAVTQDGNLALGYLAHAATVVGSSNDNNTAMGREAVGNNGYTVAVGYKATATGLSSTAVGQQALASGTGAVALGEQTTASGTDSTALGSSASATNGASTAIGRNSATTLNNQIMLGDSSTSVEVAGVAQGIFVHSSDGARWRLEVNTSGVLIVTSA